MTTSAEPPSRPSRIQGLLRRRKRVPDDITDAADQKLDNALAQLSRALGDNEVVARTLSRRQSSGGFKKVVSVPVDALGEK
jgi:hypothetical protein